MDLTIFIFLFLIELCVLGLIASTAIYGQELKHTRVKAADGTIIVLRYIWNPKTEYINHTAEPYEKYIDGHYERV